jgi:hypothetical protein
MIIEWKELRTSGPVVATNFLQVSATLIPVLRLASSVVKMLKLPANFGAEFWIKSLNHMNDTKEPTLVL